MIAIHKYFPTEYSELQAEKKFTAIDVNLAEYFYSKADFKTPELYLCILLTGYSLRHGSICCDFNLSTTTEEIADMIRKYLPEESKIVHLLKKSGICGSAGQFLPLVFENRKLYFHKYFHFEEILAQKIRNHSQQKPVTNLELLKYGMDTLFPEKTSTPDFQKIAAVNSCVNSISVISGGPGTGKTTTVVKILMLLIEQLLDQNIMPQIALTAPTGKAAAHLLNSVKSAFEKIKHFYPDAEKHEKYLPEESHTIHRLLGPLKDSPFFRHDANNRLVSNIVIVDETSMTDISLMYRFMTALHDNARIIFLGDKDQLSSVQAGSVLGDVCAFPAENISAEIIKTYNSVMKENISVQTSPDSGSIHKNIIFLKKSHRFSDDSGIGKYSGLIRDRKSDDLRNLIKENPEQTVRFISIVKNNGTLNDEAANLAIIEQFVFSEDILNGYMKYVKSSTIEEAFINFKKFKILCAVKKGFFGTEQINHNIEKMLNDKNLLNTKKPFYHLKPVIILENDYSLNLFNGDTGITFKDEVSGTLKVYFENSSAQTSKFSSYNPLQLKSWETVYAMTIHKSQGSEYDDILMILPPDNNELLTSELIYTGLTRARNRVTVVTDYEIFLSACSKKVKRMSGLNKKIYI